MSLRLRFPLVCFSIRLSRLTKVLQRHSNILQRPHSALLIVDMQDKFEKVLANFSMIEQQIVTLIRGCKILGLPVFYTEQYPKGLGHTSEKVLLYLSDSIPFEKVRFSAADDHLVSQLHKKGVRQIVLAGIEAHVCILQSALDFYEQGFQVHVVSDATGSRNPINCKVALERMRQHGFTVTATESVLFELMESADMEAFKTISKLVK